jgi:hypothetical protein
MKNKNIILIMLIVLSGLFTMQSCTKEDKTTYTIFKAAVPANPTPAVDAVVPLVGSSYTLKWEGTSSSTWDVYVGTTSKPGLAKAGVTGNSYVYTTTDGGEFFWYVVTKDANNVVSTSETWNFYINSAPMVPVLKTPAADAVDFSVTGALTWTAEDPQGDALTYDVYLGTTNTPGVVATDLTSATYSPTMVANTKYYWKVVAKDVHGATTASAVGSFTTGAEAIMTFTGDYTADEPAEAYSYDVTFAKASSTSVKTDNYWNSGWAGVFTVDLIKLTYSMPTTVWTSGYSGIESGIVDPKTGTMTGTYTIWKSGAIVEQGVHTYTKK